MRVTLKVNDKKYKYKLNGDLNEPTVILMTIEKVAKDVLRDLTKEMYDTSKTFKEFIDHYQSELEIQEADIKAKAAKREEESPIITPKANYIT